MEEFLEKKLEQFFEHFQEKSLIEGFPGNCWSISRKMFGEIFVVFSGRILKIILQKKINLRIFWRNSGWVFNKIPAKTYGGVDGKLSGAILEEKNPWSTIPKIPSWQESWFVSRISRRTLEIVSGETFGKSRHIFERFAKHLLKRISWKPIRISDGNFNGGDTHHQQKNFIWLQNHTKGEWST